jgi:protein SCO1/2
VTRVTLLRRALPKSWRLWPWLSLRSHGYRAAAHRGFEDSATATKSARHAFNARRVMMSLSVLIVLANGAYADESSLPPSLRKVGLDQHLDEQVPLDVQFRDEAGLEVTLSEYFGHGKPVVLVLAQYRCRMLCTEVLNGLVRAMLDMNLNVGTDFDVITASFDPRETPDLAAAKKTTYLERYGRPGAEAGWHFLTGDSDSIDRLTKAVGFRYTFDAKNDQYAHASGIIVLTPAGKISRYFFGIQYPPRDLRLSLVEASSSRIGSSADQVLLFCFHYDPAEGKYGPAIMNFVRLGGLLTVAGLGALVCFLWRGERRRARGTTPTAR